MNVVILSSLLAGTLVVFRLAAAQTRINRSRFTVEDRTSMPLRDISFAEHCPTVTVITVIFANCILGLHILSCGSLILYYALVLFA